MDIFYDINKFDKKSCVLCLGNFDGVHTGHRQLISKACKLAKELACDAGVYTFAVNSKILLGAGNFSLLTTDTEKNALFSELGPDFIYYDDFSKIKDYSPEEFCDYLVTNFEVKAVICGENFTFGKFAAAGSSELKKIMSKHNVGTYIISNHYVNGIGVSSTAVRNYISSGNMDSATEFLGYRYFIQTEVIHGAKLGRKLGFPTINQLAYGNKTIPAFGVYCCKCTVDDKKYIGVVNVGVKPTVTEGSDTQPVVFETNIIDYEGDLYGKTVKLEFYKYLRPEIKFPSLDALKENVLHNIEETKDFFGKDSNLQ